ncbi:SgcJ/EcaC family oxidoreductase [Streptomyces sp. LP05-1]|uniref:SgcJ/EcaC family oxidoreductase n=1 Tax=Streptomyces pyxinae TaxID=2970734 RepID=A0ABT2CF49_9ACTN|nr:SgcJ/EcaC family oxidoreductase [Streptomyces sp. LP05-1]MCS0636042.1 SgcJ/EcaC family oxidoreductase [Streptomyces sp. LP05-1]
MAQLTGDVEKHTALYVEAFNSGDADAVNAMYTEDAVAVWEPGVPLTGRARIESVEQWLAAKPKMTATPRHSFVTGDTALLIVDWKIDTTDANGEPEQLTGVGVDVLRLGEDGNWRYAIDDPFGEK